MLAQVFSSDLCVGIWSRVYGDLQLWSAVMGLVWWEPCLWGFAALIAVLGLVWWEPCLWGFAALVGSSGPRLVGAVWGFAALVGSDGPRLVGAVSMYGDLQLWSAVLEENVAFEKKIHVHVVDVAKFPRPCKGARLGDANRVVLFPALVWEFGPNVKLKIQIGISSIFGNK